MRFYALIFFVVFIPCKASAYQDSAVVAASNHYNTESITRRIFSGTNYRSTWAMPVKIPVLDIRKENGGMIIIKLGGRQTKSLYLRDKDSIDWVLRSVDKSLEKTLPGLMKNPFVEDIVQDMVSASYPYAALVVAALAKALGIPAPQPTLFYVPDDAAFGEYGQSFAHTVCMLEKTDPGFDNTVAENSDTVFKRIKETKKYRVDDTGYLKVRLLDMLVADWDRHKDQLKWGVLKYKETIVYYPIPRDRDQAFYYSNGLAPKILHLFTLKYMAGFKKNTSNVHYLNYKSWGIDKMLLNKLDEKDWRRIILAFQQTLNDAVLLSAIHELPVEVYKKDREMIFEKLKARRENLMKDAMKYYAFLSRRTNTK